MLGCESGHGGGDYEQLVMAGKMILQLHRWQAHHHPHMGDPALASRGNGVLLWFQTDYFDDLVSRATDMAAEILEPPHLNRNANHRECWLRDPDGYVVVVAGAYGDVGATAS
ncbi:glyoxalase/bleomycin resistance protein [Alcanivorax hongdengensis A-11-3]|uniref:Glyoxalase/bleomycin resistance protein n=1 Tax=Alcanivorax hongdengensis A-11-3 TaxID=1177179 RepID=L0WBH3_9GAMM|nr:glyoxalase/bleomycin resistance protein [Alcanivorax hongdengensis A-11-3]